jgi:hypothetical protein
MNPEEKFMRILIVMEQSTNLWAQSNLDIVKNKTRLQFWRKESRFLQPLLMEKFINLQFSPCSMLISQSNTLLAMALGSRCKSKKQPGVSSTEVISM